MTRTKKLFSSNRKGMDMTEGKIVPLLIAFALPLFLGNAFQQLYNTVDAWVVGNFVSNEAFSAIGTISPITTFIVGFFSGFSGGATIVIAQYFGAKRYEDVNRAVHTSIALVLVSCIFITAAGLSLSPSLLRLMKTPDSVFEDAKIYLMIYFIGSSAMMIYNIGAGILRAIGDSRRPFIFLVISALINLVFDLIFVLVFDLGVAGVAIATMVAQIISAVLVIVVLVRSSSCVKLSLKNLHFDTTILRKIISVGLPTAIQSSITSLAGIFVRSYINAFGEDFMSGVTVYGKIESIVLLPANAIAVASATFVGQNLGKRDTPRAKKGIRIAVLLAAISLVIMSIPVLIFAPDIVYFFNKKPEVIEYGTAVIRLLVPLFFFANFNTIIASALRGAGKAIYPTVIVTVTYVFLRLIYLYVVANFISNTPLPIIFSYSFSWILASIIFAVCYFKTKFESTIL